MSEQADAGASLWSAGLKFAAQRDLGSEERRQAGRWSNALIVGGCVTLAAAPFVLAVGGVAAALLSGPSRAGRAGELPVLVVGAVAAAILLTAGRTWLRRGWRLHLDARGGTARRFEGRVPDTTLDRTVRALQRGGLLRSGDTGEQWVEVLPASGLVWLVNGVRPRGWYTAPSALVADSPPFAAMAAEWVQPGDFGAEDGVHAGQRELSPAETAELRRHIRRLTVRPLVPAAALTAAAATVLWLSAGRVPGSFALPAVWLGAGAVMTDAVLVLSLFVARRYRGDVALGRVVIVRFPPSPEEAAEGVKGLSAPKEILPVSRMLWTENGQPAGWRRSPPS